MQNIGLYLFVLSFLLAVAVATISSVPWEYAACALIISIAVGYAVMHAHIELPWALFLILFAIALGWFRMLLVPTELPPAFAQLLNRKVMLQGTVVSLPDVRETNTHVTLDVSEGEIHTRIIAVEPLYPEVHIGDHITVSGTLKKPAPFSTDGGRMFAYDTFLRKDGVYAIMQPAYATIHGRSSSVWYVFMRTLERIKDFFIYQINQALPEPESALAIGLIVGGKQGLGTRLLDAFTRAGMLQIIVLSGYNAMTYCVY